mgnify:FL=1
MKRNLHAHQRRSDRSAQSQGGEFRHRAHIADAEIRRFAEPRRYPKGVENLAIAKPDGWRAWLEGDVLTITAPAKENVYAETSGEVSVVAVGATATVIAKVQVLATDEILGGAGAGSSEWEEWN